MNVMQQRMVGEPASWFLVLGFGVVGVEGAGRDSACGVDLVGGCFGADACDDADEGHGEEGGKVVEAGVRVDVAGVLCVGEGVTERLGESIKVSDNVSRSAGIQGGPLDCGVA